MDENVNETGPAQELQDFEYCPHCGKVNNYLYYNGDQDVVYMKCANGHSWCY